MLKLIKISGFIYLTCLLNAVTQAAGLGQEIATQGNAKGATACQVCHAADGGGQAAAGFPRLAGLNSAYLKKQLKDMAKGSRNTPVMTPIAKALTDKDIEAVASYYSQLPAPKVKVATTNPALLKKGKELVENGNWSKDIPACFACHGDGATGVGEHFPALAGQHASYIGQQINAWKSGLRQNDPNQLMKGIAERLSGDEIQAVSAYLASLANQ